MTRSVFFITFIMFSFNLFGQVKQKNYTTELMLDDGYIIMPFDSLTGKIEYNEVVGKEGYTKDDLFGMFNEWILINFSLKENQSISNFKINDKILLRYKFDVQIGNPKTDEKEIHCVLEFSAKNNKYRIVIKEFLLTQRIKASSSIMPFSYSMKHTDERLEQKEIETIYSNLRYRKPRQLIFEDMHDGVLSLIDSINSFFEQYEEEEW